MPLPPPITIRNFPATSSVSPSHHLLHSSPTSLFLASQTHRTQFHHPSSTHSPSQAKLCSQTSSSHLPQHSVVLPIMSHHVLHHLPLSLSLFTMPSNLNRHAIITSPSAPSVSCSCATETHPNSPHLTFLVMQTHYQLHSLPQP